MAKPIEIDDAMIFQGAGQRNTQKLEMVKCACRSCTRLSTGLLCRPCKEAGCTELKALHREN